MPTRNANRVARHVFEAEDPENPQAARDKLRSLAEGGSRRPAFTEFLESLPPIDGE